MIGSVWNFRMSRIARVAGSPSISGIIVSMRTRFTSGCLVSISSAILPFSAWSTEMRISPFTSTVIFCVRSPFAIAVATFEISRSCTVRLLARPFTLSVRSFQVP